NAGSSETFRSPADDGRVGGEHSTGWLAAGPSCIHENGMSFDLIVSNATLPDGRTGLDIAVAGGRIAAVERGISADAGRIIDANGHLVSPPVVHAHFHLAANS